MKFWWVLGILVLVLLVVGFRERFQSYDEALADVGQTAGSPGGDVTDVPKCPDGSSEYISIGDGKTGCFDKTVGDVPICPSGYIMGGKSGKCYPGQDGGGIIEDPSEAVDPVSCPEGTMRVRGVCKKVTEIKCPSGSSIYGLVENAVSGIMGARPVCVKDNASTYPINPFPSTPDPNYRECRGNDPLVIPSGKPFVSSK
jgi:hypothetical protein